MPINTEEGYNAIADALHSLHDAIVHAWPWAAHRWCVARPCLSGVSRV